MIVADGAMKKSEAIEMAQSQGSQAKTLEIPSGCDEGWFQFGSNCVKFYPEARYKPFAKRECWDNGAIILNQGF